MSQIAFSDLVNGTYPDASDFNTRFNALKNRINNGMESDNIADSSVTTAKINNNAVTYSKLDSQIVAGATTVTGASGDYLLIADVSDSNNLKKALASDFQLVAASSAEVKTGTEAAKYVAPSTLVSHEGVIKGWIKFNGTGTATILDSFNVTSITDNGTGDYTVTWDTDFGSANYAVVGSAENGQVNISAVDGATAGAVRIRTANTDGTSNVDLDKISIIAVGDR